MASNWSQAVEALHNLAIPTTFDLFDFIQRARVRGNSLRQNGPYLSKVTEGLTQVNFYGRPGAPEFKTTAHNHGRAFRSTILMGEMINQRYTLSFGSGDYLCYRMVRGGPTMALQPPVDGHLTFDCMELVPAGSSYFMPASVVHVAVNRVPTITVVRLADTSPGVEYTVTSKSHPLGQTQVKLVQSTHEEDWSHVDELLRLYTASRASL